MAELEPEGLDALEAVLMAQRVKSLEAHVEREHQLRLRERTSRRRERDALLEVVLGLLEKRDTDTGGHCRRVAGIATRICREMGYTPSDATTWGFLLHDLGKVLVPDAVLRKPGSLSPEEWIVMRRHPEEGAHLLRQVAALEGALPIVLHHHERFDGSGYPLGLRGAEIPLAARAFSVADCFDALTVDRVYRPGRPVAEALEVIVTASGTQFDPACVDAFLATMCSSDFGTLEQLPATDTQPLLGTG